MSLIRKHVAVLQAWACLALVLLELGDYCTKHGQIDDAMALFYSGLSTSLLATVKLLKCPIALA